jgi:hypothetical protein
MILNLPEPEKHIVDNYDFWFTNGQVMSLQIDPVLGDHIDFSTHPTAVTIHLAAKPHRTNPDNRLPQEDITIFLSHLLTIIKKTEEVVPLTTEQQIQWQKTVQEIAKTTKVM